MTKQQKEAYQDVEALQKLIQNLKGKKYRLSCGHHVTFCHFLGNDITIINGKTPKIICTQCGFMHFDSLKQMWISGKQVDVAPTSQRLFSNRLSVPYSHLSRCPEDLQARNLNYWMEQERKHRDTFFCRFNGQSLRAVFTERYQPLDNMEILAQLLEQGFSPGLKVQYSLDHGMFPLKIPEFEKAFGVNTGHGPLDEIIPGIVFTNSEAGLIAFTIESFCYRMVCTNGLISVAKTKASRFKHISNRGLESFPETLSMVIEDSSRNQEGFILSRQSHVDNPMASIETFSRRFGLSYSQISISWRKKWFMKSDAVGVEKKWVPKKVKKQNSLWP